MGVLGEGFAVLTVFEIGLEEVLNERGDLGEGDSFVSFAGDGLGVVDASAEDDVVAFDFLAGLEFDGGAHEADVADVVLGAGMVTAGEMNVNGLVELDFGFEILREENGLSFGVGGGEFASGIAGAGNEAAGDRGVGVVEAGGD